MFEVLSTIGDIFSAIGNFFSSLFSAIQYIIDFIYSIIHECATLLAVTPQFLISIITSAAVFSIVLACKRAVFG